MKRQFKAPVVKMMAEAGGSTVFGDVVPDEYTAYAVAHFCHALPNFSNPDTKSGYHSGFHPSSLAMNYQMLLHKHVNLNHKMKAYKNSANDKLVGMIVGVAFPEEPEGGWQIGESEEEAPAITALLAIDKLAQGVPKILGEHNGSRQKWSVSVEVEGRRKDGGIYVPSERRVADLDEINGAVLTDPKTGEMVMGTVEGKPSVYVFGGRGSKLWFPGLAMTTNPAELTAGIDTLMAESHVEGMVVRRACEAVEKYRIGMHVKWAKTLSGSVGAGIVKQVYFSGEHEKHGMRFTATLEDPVLEIRLEGKTVNILRTAASVSRVG